MTCADGKPLTQHPDGTPARCTLQAPARLDGRDCDAGSGAQFAAGGALVQCKTNPAG